MHFSLSIGDRPSGSVSGMPPNPPSAVPTAAEGLPVTITEAVEQAAGAAEATRPKQSYEDVHGRMPRGPPIDDYGLVQQVVDDGLPSELDNASAPVETPLPEAAARKLLMAIPIAKRRAASNDLAGRCRTDNTLRSWNSLSWDEKLRLVRGFVTDAEAAGATPEEFANARRMERGDPPFSSGGCAVC